MFNFIKNYLYLNKANKLFAFISFIFIVLAIIGAVRNFSNIPFWDMWDGYLGFYTRVTSGDWSSWWAQHNEHRIILSKVLFWLDLNFFHGQLWFLIAINYCLVSLSCYLFVLMLKEHAGHRAKWIVFFIVAWLFSWCQENNLTWAFQSQFFLAQLLPLSSFYLIHKSTSAVTGKELFFWGAVICGILSAGTMANGVMTLPLLLLYSLCIGSGWKKLLVLSASSVVVLSVYFYGYTPPPGHGSLVASVKYNPLGMIEYILMYVGGPFYYAVGGGNFGKLIAKFFGVLLIFCAAIIAVNALKTPRKSTLNLALLFFILYVGGSAFGTAGGRLIFGVDQSLSSRYMTPALMCWAALFTLSSPFLVKPRFERASQISLFLIIVPLLIFQFKALRNQNETIFERKVASLAVELGIKDSEQTISIYPDSDWLFTLAKEPVEKNLSLFGTQPLKDLRIKLGLKLEMDLKLIPLCVGNFIGIDQINGDDHVFKVTGTLNDPEKFSASSIVTFVGPDLKIAGFAYLSSHQRNTFLGINGETHGYGFKGYLLPKYQGKNIIAVGDRGKCLFSGIAPISIYKRSKWMDYDKINLVSVTRVEVPNAWTGSDFEKSKFPDILILGSFINSDADVGSITVIMGRGDKILYRSGPTGGRQTIGIDATGFSPLTLPISTSWGLLEFSGQHLPVKFKVKFSDNGDAWGEWSAIGVLKN